MMTDELHPSHTEPQEKPTVRRRKKQKPCSRVKVFWKRSKRRCRKAWQKALGFWDWLGSNEFEDDEIEFWRRFLRLKYILSTLLFLLTVIGIHSFVVLHK